MNKLATSKEHIESMSRFCVVLANVNKSEMQRDKNRSSQSLAKFIMGRTCHRQYMAKRSAFFVCFRQTTHSRSLQSSWSYCVIHPLRYKIGSDLAKQPLLKARFNSGCVVIAGDRTKSFEFRLIIKNLVHFIDVVTFVSKNNAEPFSGSVIMTSSFFRNILIARKHSLCIVKSRESITIQMCKVGESAFKAVYLRVLWIGKPSTNLEKEVKTAVESCHGSVSTWLIFTSKRMLPVARKDVLTTT